MRGVDDGPAFRLTCTAGGISRGRESGFSNRVLRVNCIFRKKCCLRATFLLFLPMENRWYHGRFV